MKTIFDEMRRKGKKIGIKMRRGEDRRGKEGTGRERIGQERLGEGRKRPWGEGNERWW